MLARFLCLLLALLDEERLQFLSGAVSLADCFRVIYESRRTHRGAVLDRSLVLVEMTVGELIDLSYYRANQQEKHKNQQKQDQTVKATQADYDAF